jgi:hypothetical protein
MGAAAPAAAQPAVPRAHAAAKPVSKPAASGFDVVNWLSLTPSANSLIRAPNQPVDISTHDDSDTYITVYARKKRPDVGPRIAGGYAPSQSDSALPDYDNIRYLPPTHCANGAYNTIAGQSANAADMLGFTGSGASC